MPKRYAVVVKSSPITRHTQAQLVRLRGGYEAVYEVMAEGTFEQLFDLHKALEDVG